MSIKLLIKFIFFILLLIFVTSCASIKKGEGEIFRDATPPQGYNPSFIIDTKPINSYNFAEPELTISYIDARRPDVVKFYLHLIDSSKYFIRGASTREYEKYWCNVFVTFNGQRQLISTYKLSELIDGNGLSNAISIAMDHSGSMGERRAVAVQEAVKNLIEKKRDEDALSLVRYDNRINVEVPLTSAKRQLLASHKIDGLQNYRGFTAIADAALAGMQELVSGNYDKKAVIIFTDGFDNRSTIAKDSVINYAIQNDIIVFGVDFGDFIDPNYVKELAEKTGGFYRRIYNTSEFDLLFEDMYFRLNNAYILEIETQNYGKHFVEVEICFPKDTLFAIAEFDNTPDVGQIALLQVLFDFDKDVIKAESMNAVRSLFALMQVHPTIQIELRGHTDSMNRTGDPEYNTKLSQRRADAVKKELIKLGINESRITAIGYGESIPVANNDTQEGRSKNRRTEFVIQSR